MTAGRWILFAILVYFMIKSENAYRQQKEILLAIKCYVCKENFSDEAEIDGLRMLDNIESYYATLFRFWDWGCKNILPPEDYEKIKKYLGVKP